MTNNSLTFFSFNNTLENIIVSNKVSIKYYINSGIVYSYYKNIDNNFIDYEIGNSRYNSDNIKKWFTIIRNPLTRFVECFNSLKNANIMREKQNLVNIRFYKEYSYKGFKLFDNASELLESLSLNKSNEKYIAASKILNMSYINNGYYYEFKYCLGRNWLKRNAKNAIHIAVFEDDKCFEKLSNMLDHKIPVPNNNSDSNLLTASAKSNYYKFAKNTEYETLHEFVQLGLLDEKIYNNYINSVLVI